MKVVILCGGKGIRLENSNEFIPKAMVKIGPQPMIWNVMKIFSRFGFSDFVLALGKNGHMVRDYFLNFNNNSNNITISLADNTVQYLTNNQEEDWKVTCVETGENAGTGARVSRCQEYLGDSFAVAYADCLSDVDLDAVLESHIKSGKIATITGVMPPYRYGDFIFEGDEVVDFNEKSLLKSNHGWVNGGFMIFNKEIFNYLNPFNECVLENEVFKKLAKDGQINIFKHDGFWQCLDNDRELAHLNSLYDQNLNCWLFNR
jgi:glucose-1-phosphate cytidylyltransferase